MTELTRKRTSEILRIAFDLLWFEPQGLYLHEILDHMRKNYDLTAEELTPVSFAPRYPLFEVIIRIGSIALARAGWLVKSSKGKWELTEQGRLESKQYSNAEDFFITAVREYEEWKDRESARRGRFDVLAIERAEERAREQIQGYLETMALTEVRSLVAELMRGLGFYITWTAPPDQRGGQVHLIASRDPIGLAPGRIMIHLNQSGQAATTEGLHAFTASLREVDRGLFISLSGFTGLARQEANADVQTNIRLIDLDEFIELWLGSLNKISPEGRQRLPLKPVYFLAPPES